jgi:outer membrane protein assembly factor BamB
MSVSVPSLTASTVVGQAAPIATFSVSVSGAQNGQQFYLTGKYGTKGISSVSFSGGSLPDTVTVQFKDPASLGAGTYSDTVQISVCLDQACAQPVTNSPQSVQVTYTVSASIVTLSSLSPSSAIASGPAFTLTVNGANFSSQSTVMWNGSARPTTFSSGTQVTAQITGADIAAVGSVPISVSDPINGLSNQLMFTVQQAVLAIHSISPTSVTVGGASFMLTVMGSGYSNTSAVQWNGSARPTTLVSTSELVAQISATDIAAVGTAQVTVHDAASSSGTTAAETVTIASVSKDAVAFQMNAAHTGAVTFASVSFPSNPTWSVDVGGTPSYALIAQGKVYVTVSLGGGSSQLIALDQATGATAWGPIVIAGSSNAAYDSGKVFALSSPFATAATMEAFDAGTGNQLWSTLLTGQYSFRAPPTAANGFVYTGAAGAGGTLYAVDQATGNLVWSQQVQNGDNSAPAVTADGVYVTYPCWSYDFRPATGESIWNNNTGCEGGGGATPVVANGLLYSPNGVSGYNGGIFNAESGASGGTYVADSPPAFSATMGYYLQGGTLRGITVINNTVMWSFAGDGQLAGSPIVVNQYVFIGSASGNLYALDGSTGQQMWQVSLGSAIDATVYQMPMSSLAAGDGLLVVPAGTRVTAYTLSIHP